MSSILEKVMYHLVNEEQGKAEALFHKFVVERARQIHESLRQGEDVVLSEGWDDEIKSEEYFSDDDLDSVEDGAETDDASATLGDDLGDEEDGDDTRKNFGGEDTDDLGGDADDFEDEDEDENEEVEDRLSSIEDEIEKLTADFEKMMAELDADGDAQIEDDSENPDGESEDVEGDVEGDVDGHNVDGHFDADVSDGSETDLTTEDEDFENDDLNDITESVMAELEKVTTDGKADREVGVGKYSPTRNNKSELPQKPVNSRKGGEPIKVVDKPHSGYEREPAPMVRDLQRKDGYDASARTKVKGASNRKSYKDGMEKVSKTGDNSAALNKDFAPGGSAGNSKSPIAGK